MDVSSRSVLTSNSRECWLCTQLSVLRPGFRAIHPASLYASHAGERDNPRRRGGKGCHLDVGLGDVSWELRNWEERVLASNARSKVTVSDPAVVSSKGSVSHCETRYPDRASTFCDHLADERCAEHPGDQRGSNIRYISTWISDNRIESRPPMSWDYRYTTCPCGRSSHQAAGDVHYDRDPSIVASRM